jgi:ACR3 family arsenite efflux pump ArsB
MVRLVATMERWQIGLYLLAIVVGATYGLLAPEAAEPLEYAINPVLGLLLFTTFLGIPFAQIGQAVRDVRFMVTILVLNFVVVPLVVLVLSRFVADNQALLVGVLMVLLTPCIDYVIVFAGLAGGSSDRLLAAAPLLMLAQMLLLPLYLVIFVGPGLINSIDAEPFIEALVGLIIIPLVLASDHAMVGPSLGSRPDSHDRHASSDGAADDGHTGHRDWLANSRCRRRNYLLAGRHPAIRGVSDRDGPIGYRLVTSS